jgi:hypothetical protein
MRPRKTAMPTTRPTMTAPTPSSPMKPVESRAANHPAAANRATAKIGNRKKTA